MPKLHWMGTAIDSIPNNLRVTVEQKPKAAFGRFQAVGPFSTHYEKSDYDILERYAELTPCAQQLFNQIKLHRDSHNFCVYDLPFDRTRQCSHYKQHSRALTHLKTAGFLKQLRKAHIDVFKLNVPKNAQAFIINPELVRCEKYKSSRIIWRELK